ncbi:transposase [Streptomyces massasporeus]
MLQVEPAQEGVPGPVDVRVGGNGRKRHLLTDTLGLLLAVLVTPASVTDRERPDPSADGSRPLQAAGTGLGRRRLHRPPHRLDQPASGIVLDIVRRGEDARGFQLLPRRWVVERSFACLLRSRRLVRDYEHRIDTSKAVIRWSMIALMNRRLAAQSHQSALLPAG